MSRELLYSCMYLGEVWPVWEMRGGWISGWFCIVTVVL